MSSIFDRIKDALTRRAASATLTFRHLGEQLASGVDLDPETVAEALEELHATPDQLEELVGRLRRRDALRLMIAPLPGAQQAAKAARAKLAEFDAETEHLLQARCTEHDSLEADRHRLEAQVAELNRARRELEDLQAELEPESGARLRELRRARTEVESLPALARQLADVRARLQAAEAADNPDPGTLGSLREELRHLSARVERAEGLARAYTNELPGLEAALLR